MAILKKTLCRLKNDRRAVTALEYGLIAALIAGVLVTVISNIGTDLKATFSSLGTAITTANK